MPRGGEEVSVGRLMKVPPGPDLDTSSSPASAAEAPPRALSEAERRTCNRLTAGLMVLFRRQDEAGLGEIQQNQNRRMVLVVAEFAMLGNEWQRVFLDEDGSLTHVATGRPAQHEVPYLEVWGRARFRAGVQSLDSSSARLLEAHRLSPFRLAPAARPRWRASALRGPLGDAASSQAGAEPGGPGEPEAPVALAGIKAEGKAEVPSAHVELLILPGGPKRLPLVDLSPEDRQRAEADEVLFSLDDRLGERYASYVGAATQDLLKDVAHLSAADKAAVIFTAVHCRASLWLPGSAYSRIQGAYYELDTGDAAPVTQHPFRKSPDLAADVEWHIRQNVNLGVLVPGVGAWATPAFVVAQKGKPHGRMVCDYRKVNSVTRRMYHPMPAVMEVIRSVMGGVLFTGLDAVSGFNQLELSRAASEKLAIVVPSGLYFWKVLPFGPMDGPQAFTAVTRRIFQEVKCLEVYIDDLAVHTGLQDAACRG